RADLRGAHWVALPTVEPSYWTEEPESVRRLKADPGLIRIFALGDKSAGEPGYASERVDFLAARDPLEWSLPPVWHVAGSLGKTPMISRRLDLFARVTEKFPWRHDLECDSHIVTGSRWRGRILRGSSEPAGSAFILRNAGALPRARLVGRPSYAEDQRQAVLELTRLGAQLRDRLVVEDPSHPLAGDAAVSGTARI